MKDNVKKASFEIRQALSKRLIQGKLWLKLKDKVTYRVALDIFNDNGVKMLALTDTYEKGDNRLEKSTLASIVNILDKNNITEYEFKEIVEDINYHYLSNAFLPKY